MVQSDPDFSPFPDVSIGPSGFEQLETSAMQNLLKTMAHQPPYYLPIEMVVELSV